MPPKKANKKDTEAAAAVVSPPAADVVASPPPPTTAVTPSSPAKKSPKKPAAAAKKATKAATNGVAKAEKPKKAAPAPKKKTPKKEDKAAIAASSSGGEGSPKKSPKKAVKAVKSADEASPKKKAAKKRPKSDADENSQTEASGAEGGASPVKKAKKAAAKPKKEAAAGAKSPKKAAAPAKPKQTKAKEAGPESAPEGAAVESPKKKKAAKKKVETPADGSEAPAPKKSKKKKEEKSDEPGADAPVKEKKKAAPKKKKAEGEAAVAATGPSSGTEGESSPKKKVSKPRPKKPKPVEDDTPVVGQRKGFQPMPKEKPSLLKKAVTSKNKPKKAEATADETAGSDDEEEEQQQAAQKPSSSSSKSGGKKLQNSTETDWENQQFQINHQFRLKIASWNVSGLRAWLDKGGKKYLLHEHPDIVCLQETKCKLEDIPDAAAFSGYHPYWLGFSGQAGVGIYSRQMPINVSYGIGDKEMDEEGRLMCAEYEKFFLVNVYVPNAGRKLVTLPKRLRWNKLFKEYIEGLDKKKPVIVCGDMNVAHEEIDLANPKTNKKNAGFTQEERDGMTEFLNDCDFVDTFRHFYPNEKGAYTFWTYMMNARAKNVGWRLDYILVSKRILDKVVDNKIRSRVLGSDHCPIVGFFNL